MNILDLPSELLVAIFEFLKVKDLLSCSLACRLFHEITVDERFTEGFVFEEKYSPQSQIPVGRVTPAAAYVGRTLYVHGGNSLHPGAETIKEIRSDMWKYDINTKKWTEMKTFYFKARTEHTCNYHDGTLWYFGGAVLGHGYVHFVTSYNCQTGPTARSTTSSCMMDGKLCIFGGWNGQEWFNDLHLFDTKLLTWETVEPKGDVPCKRCYHACGKYNNLMFVFGGYTGTSYLNDLHVWNYDTREWKNLTFLQKGTIPPPRSRADAAVYGNCFYLLSGWFRKGYYADLYELNFDTLVWRQIQHPHYSIPSVSQHRIGIVECDDGVYIYSFGGYISNTQEVTNKMFKIKIKTQRNHTDNVIAE